MRTVELPLSVHEGWLSRSWTLFWHQVMGPSENAPASTRLALVEDSAPDVLVEPVISAREYFEWRVTGEEVSIHPGAELPRVRTSLIEGL